MKNIGDKLLSLLPVIALVVSVCCFAIVTVINIDTMHKIEEARQNLQEAKETIQKTKKVLEIYQNEIDEMNGY